MDEGNQKSTFYGIVIVFMCGMVIGLLIGNLRWAG